MADRLADDFTPLADVAEFPLHMKLVNKDHRWGCDEPESPRDDYVDYDWRCAGCVAHAEASIAIQGDMEQSWAREPGGDYEAKPIMLGWLVARARYWGVR